MKGPADELKQAGDRLLATRGVKHGGMELIAVGASHAHEHAHDHELPMDLYLKRLNDQIARLDAIDLLQREAEATMWRTHQILLRLWRVHNVSRTRRRQTQEVTL